MSNNIYIYIAVMALTTLVIRALPLTVLRKQIKSKFIRSFLYYVPYVTLAVMTFPAIMDGTSNWIAGFLALVVGIVMAWFNLGLFPTALASCAVVLIFNFIVK